MPGFGRLVDSGDFGDTYNYSPPTLDTVVDTPDSVKVEIGDQGPVRATVTITSVYDWPDRVDEATRSRTGSHQVTVTTTLEVRADEEVVRVRTHFVNPSRDHRVRVHLPLPRPDSALTGRMRLHRGRAGSGGRGTDGGISDAHLPVPALRVQWRPDRDPRGPPRVRADRHRGRPGRREHRPGHHVGPDRAALHGHAVPDGHDHPAHDRRAHDPSGGGTDDRAGGR